MLQAATGQWITEGRKAAIVASCELACSVLSKAVPPFSFARLRLRPILAKGMTKLQQSMRTNQLGPVIELPA